MHSVVGEGSPAAARVVEFPARRPVPWVQLVPPLHPGGRDLSDLASGECSSDVLNRLLVAHVVRHHEGDARFLADYGLDLQGLLQTHGQRFLADYWNVAQKRGLDGARV